MLKYQLDISNESKFDEKNLFSSKNWYHTYYLRDIVALAGFVEDDNLQTEIDTRTLLF